MLGSIPEGEREHAIRALERPLDAPFIECCKQHFCVGMTAKAVSTCGELGMQILEVVYLAIEDDDIASGVRVHRLTSLWREVDDRQTTVSERSEERRVGNEGNAP